MKKVTLPDKFKDYNFANLAKKEKKATLKVRYLVFSYIAAGKTVVEAANLVYKSNRMVHRWINKFKDFGLEGLKDKPGRGRKLALPLEKEKDFKKSVIELQNKKGHNKISGRDISKLLKNNYNIKCTLPTAYNILKRLELNYTKHNKNATVVNNEQRLGKYKTHTTKNYH